MMMFSTTILFVSTILLSMTTVAHGFQIHNGNGRVVFRNQQQQLCAVAAADESMTRDIVDTWSHQAAIARKELEELERNHNSVELGSVAETPETVVRRLSEEEKRMQWAMKLQECKPELAMKAQRVRNTLNQLHPPKRTKRVSRNQPTACSKRAFVNRTFVHAY